MCGFLFKWLGIACRIPPNKYNSYCTFRLEHITWLTCKCLQCHLLSGSSDLKYHSIINEGEKNYDYCAKISTISTEEIGAKCVIRNSDAETACGYLVYLLLNEYFKDLEPQTSQMFSNPVFSSSSEAIKYDFVSRLTDRNPYTTTPRSCIAVKQSERSLWFSHTLSSFVHTCIRQSDNQLWAACGHDFWGWD